MTTPEEFMRQRSPFMPPEYAFGGPDPDTEAAAMLDAELDADMRAEPPIPAEAWERALGDDQPVCARCDLDAPCECSCPSVFEARTVHVAPIGTEPGSPGWRELGHDAHRLTCSRCGRENYDDETVWTFEPGPAHTQSVPVCGGGCRRIAQGQARETPVDPAWQPTSTTRERFRYGRFVVDSVELRCPIHRVRRCTICVDAKPTCALCRAEAEQLVEVLQEGTDKPGSPSSKHVCTDCALDRPIVLIPAMRPTDYTYANDLHVPGCREHTLDPRYSEDALARDRVVAYCLLCGQRVSTTRDELENTPLPTYTERAHP